MNENEPIATPITRLNQIIEETYELYFENTESGAAQFGSVVIVPELRPNAGWGRMMFENGELTSLIFHPPIKKHGEFYEYKITPHHSWYIVTGSKLKLDDKIKPPLEFRIKSSERVDEILTQAADCIEASIDNVIFEALAYALPTRPTSFLGRLAARAMPYLGN